MIRKKETGNKNKATMSHLSAATGPILLRDNLELRSKFYFTVSFMVCEPSVTTKKTPSSTLQGSDTRRRLFAGKENLDSQEDYGVSLASAIQQSDLSFPKKETYDEKLNIVSFLNLLIT